LIDQFFQPFGRDAQSKADEIDSAVFDLKAVNPNVVTKMDDRTPEEIIGKIEEQGKVVASVSGAVNM